MCISEKSLRHDYRGKSHLTYLIVFYHKMTGSADKERAVGVIYLDFSKTCDTITHS